MLVELDICIQRVYLNLHCMLTLIKYDSIVFIEIAMTLRYLHVLVGCNNVYVSVKTMKIADLCVCARVHVKISYIYKYNKKLYVCVYTQHTIKHTYVHV